MLRPAASATTRKRVRASRPRTSTVWRPIDPVDPISATRTDAAAAAGLTSADRGEDEQGHDRRGEQEGVDAIQDPAVARDQRS